MKSMEKFYISITDAKLGIILEILSNCDKIQEICVCNHDLNGTSDQILQIVTIVLSFPKLSKFYASGIMNDEILTLIASKSNELKNLRELCLSPNRGFSLNAFQKFLKNAKFSSHVDMNLKIAAELEEFEEMAKNYKKSSLKVLEVGNNNKIINKFRKNDH
uniref:Uncharacterized protein n=1 Tax=Panagrolaimus sp. JU765 TaxID=591449 RepID=A0AC34RBD4_9BILA